jgi:hypothetical protein
MPVKSNASRVGQMPFAHITTSSSSTAPTQPVAERHLSSLQVQGVSKLLGLTPGVSSPRQNREKISYQYFFSSSGATA